MALLLAFYGAVWPAEQRTAEQGEERSLRICWLFQLSAKLSAAAVLSFRKGGEALLKGPANTPPLLVCIYTNPIFLKQIFKKITISFYDIVSAFAGFWLICPINIRAL